MASSFEIFIFSWNRGWFLQNCLDSVSLCAGGFRTTVIDDGSDDPATLEVLRRAETSGYRVVRVSHEDKTRHGGLWANMRRVVDQEATADIGLMLQDDMQFVRPLFRTDIEDITDFFEHFQESVFMAPTFIKGSLPQHLARTRPHESFPVYFADFDLVEHRYSDVCLFHRKRLSGHSAIFGESEKAISEKILEVFGPKAAMGYMKNPFVAWLPRVPNYRGKRQSVAMKLAIRLGVAGQYPFRLMTTEQSESFRQRPIQQMPVAEDFLTAPGLRPSRKGWAYDPLDTSRFLARLNGLERRLRLLLQGGA